MTCKNCGEQLPENETKCPKCGTDNSSEDLNVSAAGAERAVPRGFSAKKNIIIIVIAAVLLIGGGITAIAVVNSHSASGGISDKLKLAERFLSEQNYEQAVIEYQKVLEIEPMNVDAYLGLADTYISMGDLNKAITSLRDGLEQTKDDKIKARLIEELFNRAQDYDHAGEYDKAIADLQSILELNYKNADAYIKLADMYLALGDTDKALEMLRKGLEKTSDVRIRSKLDELNAQNAPQEPTYNEPTISEPEEPVYGSMGSVTIAGTELDIATTSRLLIINKELYSNGNWRSSAIDNNPEEYYDGIVYITENISNEDLEKLQQLSRLSSLEIYYAGITDLSPISKLTNIKRLDLQNNQIKDITPLAELSNLINLDLQNNQINDVTLLENLTNLTWLYLTDNQISDITPLAKLTNLTGLSLDGNQISDIMPLAKLTNLTQLNLFVNQISDITPLAKLTNLTHLELGGNQISDITPLAKLTNLTFLDLRNNQISDISPLAKLTNLTRLVLSNNQISAEDLAGLQDKLPNCSIS